MRSSLATPCNNSGVLEEEKEEVDPDHSYDNPANLTTPEEEYF